MNNKDKENSAKKLRILRFSGVLAFVGTFIFALIYTGNDQFLKRCVANGNSVKYCNDVYDDRNWYLLRCRLSMLGIRILAESFYNIIYRIYNAASKVLILDCDNTLWGGVVGEEGLNKILLGIKLYYLFQTS